jgi:hypothetical protein
VGEVLVFRSEPGLTGSRGENSAEKLTDGHFERAVYVWSWRGVKWVYGGKGDEERDGTTPCLSLLSDLMRCIGGDPTFLEDAL